MITPVTNQQIKQLQAISEQTFTETFGEQNSPEDLQNYLQQTYSIERLTSELNDENCFYYFLQYNKQIAGYLKLNIGSSQSESKYPDSLEIERIYILSEFQKLGLGQKLIDYAEQVATDLKVNQVWLGVWEHNVNALKFYNRNNYQPIDEHIFVLGDDKQRDIIMAKQLI